MHDFPTTTMRLFSEMLDRERTAAFLAGVNALEEELVRQDRFTEATLRIADEVRRSQSHGGAEIGTTIETEGADQ